LSPLLIGALLFYCYRVQTNKQSKQTKQTNKQTNRQSKAKQK